MKKLKRFLCTLCCMALIISMTVDVNAAEALGGLGLASTDEVTDEAPENETGAGNEAQDSQTPDGEQESDETDKENPEITETPDETNKDGESDKKQSEETENTEGTDGNENLNGNEDEDENSSDKTKEDEIAEAPDKTDVDEENINKEMPENSDARTASVNNIWDDAYVSYFSDDQKDTIFADDKAKSGHLILGKQRYVYLRLDLSNIDETAEKITLQCFWASSSKSSTIVVNECSEYLRQDDSNDSSDRWTQYNINYNNRPLDKEIIIQELTWSSAPYEIDLTDFIRNKINADAETACIKISTTTVDDRTVNAMELHSSRSTAETNRPRLVVTAAKLSVNNIFDDAFVSNNSSADANANFASDASKSNTLIFGKKRHVYLRFDLSDIDINSEKIVFQGTYNKGSRASITVNECSEYLSGSDGTTKWTKDNITYNNRPADTDTRIYDEMAWLSGPLEIDLTDFIKGKIENGDKTACIHFTTTTVETDTPAVEIYSSRNTDDAVKPGLMAMPAIKPSVNNIFDDAYVDSSKGNDNYKDKTSLVFGKYRHLYFRFDLSNIPEDADKVIFRGTYNKGTRKSVVVTETSEYLRADDNTDSETKWTTDTITYNNRPIDKESAIYAELPWPNSQTNLEIDLTDFVKDKLSTGAETACIHITTTTVDQDSVAAVEIYSSRSDSGKPKLIVSTPDDEEPVGLEREKTGNDYYDNGYLIQKVIRIRTADNLYLKTEGSGAVTTTENADDAGLFGLHVYQYDKYEQESYGATKTTYAFENLDTGKFLTIQNYFTENDSNKAYYNLDGGKYIIKAAAPDVNWNERFDLQYYPDSQYYTIASHLEVYRDGSDAVSPLYMENNTLKCGKNDDEFRFYLEEVENQDKLKVLQEVKGNSVKLFWKPVNQDKTPENYQMENQTISYDAEKDELYTQLTGLSTGLHEFRVSYNGRQETVKVRIFNHMALAHSEEQLEQMAEHIRKGEEPWYSDYQRLLKQVPLHMSDPSFEVNAEEGIGRGDPAGHGNIGAYERASNAAYYNALLWVITGEDQYAQTGVKILNAWADTLKIVDGRDRILGAAISTYRLNNAAEILKYYHGGYNGYSDEDFHKYQDMLLNVIYPVVQDLGLPMKANGNWDTAAMAAMVTIGAVCENTEIFERAVYLYQDIHTNGSIAVYVSEWGQSVESYRDQAHAQLGISYMADVCETAQKQGIDLYGMYDNRLAKGFNWAAQYNLYNTENLRMEPLTDVFGQKKWNTIDQEKINRGELRSVYELPLAHYFRVEGVDVTWMQKAAEAMRPQGYVNNDHLNFGTLTTYNGEVTKAPEPYFQLRTRLEPWYQRTWNDAKKYGDITDNIPETLNSYFAIDETGNVTASGKKADAPFFQLENQEDGTYAIWCVTAGKYLSVKEVIESDANGNAVRNAIRADAESVGENEKFLLKGTGASFFYLEAPGFGNRILNINVTYPENSQSTNDPKDAVLTLELGSRITDDCDTVSNNERFILVYNTADVALKDIGSAVDTSDLEAYISSLADVNNDDGKYTEESFRLFTQKLAAAKLCVSDAKNEKVSQNIVDKALQELKKAYENLELYTPDNPPIGEYVAAVPKADIESGEVPAETQITLTCATEGASIYYTTDGSHPDKTNGTLYEGPITVIENITIKAIAVKDGYQDSEVATFRYTVSGSAEVMTVFAPTSDRPSGVVARGTKITLICATENASIYYTTDDSTPGTANGMLYENPISIDEDMTIKAIAVKSGWKDSKIVTYQYTVSTGLKITVDDISYDCRTDEPIMTEASYTYTGSAIKPRVTVMNNGRLLTLGTDYTVKYAGNIKVPSPNAKNTQKPRIIITGKNSLKGNAILYFTIQAKNIADSDVTCTEPLVVAENKTASPTLYYEGQKLTANRNFTVDLASRKWKLSDNNDENAITLTGKGNYTGERKIRIHVAAKNELQKFTVKLDTSMNSIVYDGNAHEPEFAIYNTKDADKKQLTPDNYYVIFPNDITNAGTKKFTVVGTGIYTGCSITKSYKIKPSANNEGIIISKGGPEEYLYTRSGVTFGEGDLVVMSGDKVLEEGKDYRITYSGNKKKTNNAKYSVTFLGNYKGTKNVPNQTGTFKIAAANLEDQNWKTAALDKIYKKPGVYKTKIYVSVDNILLKASDYTVTYRLSDGNTMTSKNKLDLEKVTGTVDVEITGKGNYCGTIHTSYQVNKSELLKDLTKAKITVVDENGNKLKNVQFDGNEQEVHLRIEMKEGKKYKEITSEEYHALTPCITYVNHVYKGKATIVINGDGKIFTGGKSVTFNIVSKDITTKK